jgi:hypothetical protein
MKGFSLVAALVALQSAFLFSVGRSPSPEQAAARLAAASRRAVAAVSSRDVVVVSAPRHAERVVLASR